jgi:hypothetical protein
MGLNKQLHKNQQGGKVKKTTYAWLRIWVSSIEKKKYKKKP